MLTRDRLVSSVRDLWHLVIKEIAKFGVVGAIAFVIDNFTFAFLLYGPPGPMDGPLAGHHKLSSAGATAVATLVSWVGNRYWTFRDKRNVNRGRELLLFSFFNVVGLLITLGCVMIAVDVLHLRGLAWETTARNIGIVLGTLFRFWTYRSYVFRAELDEDFGPVHPRHSAHPEHADGAGQLPSAAERNKAKTTG